MGRLHSVVVDIKGVCIVVDFQVIEIMDDKNPYPALLGLEFPFDTNEIINLNKRKIVFKKGDLGVIFPFDPSEGVRYIEPVCDEYGNTDIENIYNMTAK